MKKNNYMPRSLDVDQEKIAELVKVYQAGVDWGLVHRQAVERLNNKFEEKLINAKISNSSEKSLSAIKKRWEETLSNEPTLLKLKAMADAKPKPSRADEAKSKEAAGELVMMNEKLVIYIIRKHFSTYVGSDHYDDMVNEGMMGLFQSLMSYDPKRSSFSTYARYFIQHAIYDFMSGLHGSSTYYQSQAKLYKETISKLQNEGNLAPTVSDIASEMGVGLEAVSKLMSVMSRANPISLNDETVGARPVDPLKFSPEEIVANNELVEKINGAVGGLPEDQRFVINRLYYSEEGKPGKYSAIGAELARLKNPNVPEHELKPIGSDDVRKLKATALRSLFERLSGYYANGKASEIPVLKNQSLRINIYPDHSSIIGDIDSIHDLDIAV